MGLDAEHRNEPADSKQLWEFSYQLTNCLPIPMAALRRGSGARLLTGFMGSNPARGMDICLL